MSGYTSSPSKPKLSTPVKVKKPRQVVPDIQKGQIPDWNPLIYFGQGVYGNVWLCQHKNKIRKSIVKKMFIKDDQYTFYQRVNHPYIVKLRDVKANKQFRYLFFDKYWGDLKVFKQHWSVFAPWKIQKLILNMVQVLVYLESKRIVHYDIKQQNIFVQQTPLQYHLGDWGLAQFKSNPQNKKIDLLMFAAVVWKSCGLQWPLPTYYPVFSDVYKHPFIQTTLGQFQFVTQTVKKFFYFCFKRQFYNDDISTLLDHLKQKQSKDFFSRASPFKPEVKYQIQSQQIQEMPSSQQNQSVEANVSNEQPVQPVQPVIVNDLQVPQLLNPKKTKGVVKGRKKRRAKAQFVRCKICNQLKSLSNIRKHERRHDIN